MERVMPTDEATGVVVPLDLLAVAAEVVAEHVQAHVVADYIEAQFGRRVVARLISQELIQRIHREPGQGLDTSGPILLREVVLVDEAPPHRPLAVSNALIVPDRLPDLIRAELASSAEPLDRLLTRRGVDWQVRLRSDEGFVAPFGLASRDFSWLGEEAGAAVELLRQVHVAGRPVAVLVDELPLPSRRAEPTLA
jgi:hypothetical protein